MYKKFYLLSMSFMFLITLTACSKASFPFVNNNQAAVMTKTNPDSNYQSTAFLQGNATVIWYKLQQTSTPRLREMLAKRNDYTDKGWIELALINKRYNNKNIYRLPDELIAWRNRYPNHPANALLPNDNSLQRLNETPPPTQIAILLPQTGRYAASSRKVREGILNAYYANSSKGPNQNIKFYDTSHTTDIAALYQKATAEGADFVIGPLTKEEVIGIRQSPDFSSPIIALNYSDYGSSPSNFYEFGLSPNDEASMAAERAYQEGLTHAIVIAPDNDKGKRLVQAFSSKWSALGGSIQDTWLYHSRGSFNEEVARLLKIDLQIDKQLMREANNREILSQQRRHDFDVIFLFAQSSDARVIVPLLRYYYANDVPIYGSSSVYAGKLSAANDKDLNGVIICDIPWSKQGDSGHGRAGNRLFAVGQDAYTLSQSLPTLSQINNFPIYGKTGALTLTDNQQIHRRLPCRAIKHGTL